MPLAIAVVASVAAGRACGGLLADRFGWRLIGLGGLLFAVPFLLAGWESVACGVLGVGLLNLALPITSTRVFVRLPASPAFAFGLVSLALMAGGLPAITSMLVPQPPTGIGVLAVLTAWAGLLIGTRKVNTCTSELT